ncbi:hypothetical protein TNCV_2955791 [Trichonephila clavipes]|nr:hypothetical protein TNCV_2955791 [Trichonephila clavipes]
MCAIKVSLEASARMPMAHSRKRQNTINSFIGQSVKKMKPKKTRVNKDTNVNYLYKRILVYLPILNIRFENTHFLERIRTSLEANGTYESTFKK